MFHGAIVSLCRWVLVACVGGGVGPKERTNPIPTQASIRIPGFETTDRGLNSGPSPPFFPSQVFCSVFAWFCWGRVAFWGGAAQGRQRRRSPRREAPGQLADLHLRQLGKEVPAPGGPWHLADAGLGWHEPDGGASRGSAPGAGSSVCQVQYLSYLFGQSGSAAESGSCAGS